MPKAKPSQVIVHRIELQEKEREALEALTGGYVIKSVVQPVAIAGGIGVGGYLAYKSLKSAYQWSEDIVEDIKRTPLGIGASLVDDVSPAVRGLKRLTNWLITPVGNQGEN